MALPLRSTQRAAPQFFCYHVDNFMQSPYVEKLKNFQYTVKIFEFINLLVVLFSPHTKDKQHPLSRCLIGKRNGVLPIHQSCMLCASQRVTQNIKTKYNCLGIYSKFL